MIFCLIRNGAHIKVGPGGIIQSACFVHLLDIQAQHVEERVPVPQFRLEFVVSDTEQQDYVDVVRKLVGGGESLCGFCGLDSRVHDLHLQLVLLGRVQLADCMFVRLLEYYFVRFVLVYYLRVGFRRVQIEVSYLSCEVRLDVHLYSTARHSSCEFGFRRLQPI